MTDKWRKNLGGPLPRTRRTDHPAQGIATYLPAWLHRRARTPITMFHWPFRTGRPRFDNSVPDGLERRLALLSRLLGPVLLLTVLMLSIWGGIALLN